MRKFFYLSFVVFSFSACHNAPVEGTRSFVDVPGLDSSIKPGDNFFRFVNGKWYDTVQIANDQTGIGSYQFLNIPQQLLLQHILDSVSRMPHEAGTIDQQVGDFFASGMDTTTINARGYAPVQSLLARIGAVTDVSSLIQLAAIQSKEGNYSILGWGVTPDNMNSSMNIAYLGQTGIGLPERDYYFKTDSPTLRIQDAYRKYMATLFELTGSDSTSAVRDAGLVYGIEKQLATAHKTNIELRDVQGNYHKVTVASIVKTQPNLHWRDAFAGLGAATDSVDMAQPGYYDKLNVLLTTIPIKDWKVYMRAMTLENYADVLSKPFVDASFAFRKALTGQDVQKPRGKIMTEQVDGLLGQALGQLYVKRYFNEDAKKRVNELVDNLEKSFENRIDHLDWMSDSTKRKAVEKLHAISRKIGYPDKWRDYSQVHIDKAKYFENILALREDQYRYQLAKLNKPVDRTEWQTTPSTVTAYYNPYFNEIVFPAGILQYPYFDFGADDAINYGGIGMVIGHEMTHAFDDQGAQFDKDGNVKNWWTKDDYAKFRERTKRVVDLYNTFTVLDSVHVKGALTLGENTADNGGIQIAYDAFKMTPEGHDSVKIDGFTPDQRFYLSIGRIWRVKTRDAFLRMYVNTNPHSPAMWRVNGPCMSAAPFYKAFNVQPGDKNYLPEDQRIKVW